MVVPAVTVKTSQTSLTMAALSSTSIRPLSLSRPDQVWQPYFFYCLHTTLTNSSWSDGCHRSQFWPSLTAIIPNAVTPPPISSQDELTESDGIWGLCLMAVSLSPPSALSALSLYSLYCTSHGTATDRIRQLSFVLQVCHIYVLASIGLPAFIRFSISSYCWSGNVLSQHEFLGGHMNPVIKPISVSCRESACFTVQKYPCIL